MLVHDYIFPTRSSKLSTVKDDLAAEKKEEESWRDELREISGTYANVCFEIETKCAYGIP